MVMDCQEKVRAILRVVERCKLPLRRTGSSSGKPPAGRARDRPRHSEPAPSGSAMAHFGRKRLRAPGALLVAHGAARRSGLRVRHLMGHDQQQKALGG